MPVGRQDSKKVGFLFKIRHRINLQRHYSYNVHVFTEDTNGNVLPFYVRATESYGKGISNKLNK